MSIFRLPVLGRVHAPQVAYGHRHGRTQCLAKRRSDRCGQPAAAIHTTGLLTAGRKQGDRPDPVCQPLTTEGDNIAFEGQIPTARQRTLRENVQQAKLKGLSFRKTARELGIHRNTVREYALAESPPLRKIKSAATTLQPETGTPA